MARPAATSVRQTFSDQDMVMLMLTAIQNLFAEHDTLLAKLDLDAGVTDTNYTALVATHPSIAPYK